MRFYRYHAIGNDYIVIPETELDAPLAPAVIQRICHRNFGIGSDGILLHLPDEGPGRFKLRIFNPDGSAWDETRRLGALIEVAPRFPNRTNVQFMRVRDRSNIEIQIWERGAGFTLASGSSSSAAAGVAHRLGWCDSDITVHMPGGRIRIEID